MASDDEIPTPKAKDRHRGILISTRLSPSLYLELDRRREILDLNSVSAFLKWWLSHTFERLPVKRAKFTR